MKNKRGFTLVELIAIVIIIGIIIGIISPTAIKLIEKSKTNSYREGLRSIIRSAEIYMEENDLKALPDEGLYLVDNDLDIDYADGYTGIIKYINGEIVLQNIGNGKYCGNGGKDSLTIANYSESCIVEKPEVIIPETQCFIMGTTDTTGDTITGYDYENIECNPTNIVIPATVNSVPVKYIGGGAFLQHYDLEIGIGSYDASAIGGPSNLPIVDIVSNLEYLGIDIIASYYVVDFPVTTKRCATSAGEDVEVSYDYELSSSSNYLLCTSLMLSDPTDYMVNGIGITTVDFSNAINLVGIGDSAFIYNYLAGTLDLSGAVNLKEIEYQAFTENQLESVKLPSKLESIGMGSFASNVMSSVTIPASVTSISNYAFEDNDWLSVIIETNVSNSKYRFNTIWSTIGWPSSLMIDQPASDPINYVLSTSSANIFSYIKGYYIVNVQTSGNYKLEVWAGSGSNGEYEDTLNYEIISYNGGYTTGNVYLTSGTNIYVYVGGAGTDANGGYNGGGNSISTDGDCEDNGGGGGATDIRLVGGVWNVESSLLSRIIVAGGGGGGRARAISTNGGTEIGLAGSQTQSGVSIDTENSWHSETTCDIIGGFGYGGSQEESDDNPGGGGGWYGGCIAFDGFGGGGSNYVLNSSSYKPTGYTPSSTYYISSSSSLAGNVAMPTYDGVSTMIGNTGNGYAKITYIG